MYQTISTYVWIFILLIFKSNGKVFFILIFLFFDIKFLSGFTVDALQGDAVGCFNRSSLIDSFGTDVFQLMDSSSAADSPANCINMCQQQFFK